MHLHGLLGWRPLKRQKGQRAAVWLQAKVREHGLGLWPRLNVGPDSGAHISFRYLTN